jgi:hypothetical protein
MTISKKVADILWAVAERYLASLPEDERNQILSRAGKNSVSLATPVEYENVIEQSTSSNNS